VLGKQQDPGRQLDPVGDGSGEAQRDQRIQPVGSGEHRDPAVVGVRVARHRFVDHHDVLTHPQRREPAPLGRSGNRIDHGAMGTRADTETVQPNTDHVANRGSANSLPERRSGCGTATVSSGACDPGG
jgi:hypothetical protein